MQRKELALEIILSNWERAAAKNAKQNSQEKMSRFNVPRKDCTSCTDRRGDTTISGENILLSLWW